MPDSKINIWVKLQDIHLIWSRGDKQDVTEIAARIATARHKPPNAAGCKEHLALVPHTNPQKLWNVCRAFLRRNTKQKARNSVTRFYLLFFFTFGKLYILKTTSHQMLRGVLWSQRVVETQNICPLISWFVPDLTIFVRLNLLILENGK